MRCERLERPGIQLAVSCHGRGPCADRKLAVRTIHQGGGTLAVVIRRREQGWVYVVDERLQRRRLAHLNRAGVGGQSGIG